MIAGDLHKREPYTEAQTGDIVAQLLKAVAYMHKEGYVHRDLKFDSIMFESKDSNVVKIIEFGLSSTQGLDWHTRLTELVPTPYPLLPLQSILELDIGTSWHNPVQHVTRSFTRQLCDAC